MGSMPLLPRELLPFPWPCVSCFQFSPCVQSPEPPAPSQPPAAGARLAVWGWEARDGHGRSCLASKKRRVRPRLVQLRAPRLPRGAVGVSGSSLGREGEKRCPVPRAAPSLSPHPQLLGCIIDFPLTRS